MLRTVTKNKKAKQKEIRTILRTVEGYDNKYWAKNEILRICS